MAQTQGNYSAANVNAYDVNANLSAGVLTLYPDRYRSIELTNILGDFTVNLALDNATENGNELYVKFNLTGVTNRTVTFGTLIHDETGAGYITLTAPSKTTVVFILFNNTYEVKLLA